MFVYNKLRFMECNMQNALFTLPKTSKYTQHLNLIFGNEVQKTCHDFILIVSFNCTFHLLTC